MAAVTNPGRTNDGTTRFDPRPGADIDGADNLAAFPGNRGIGSNPNAWLDFLARHGYVGNLAAQHALQHRPIIRQPANVDPVEKAALGIEGQAAFSQEGEQLATDVEFDARRYQIQNGRFKQINTGTRQGGFGVSGLWLFLEGCDPAVFIGHDNAVVLHLFAGNIQRNHAGQGRLLMVLLQGSANIEVDDRIAANDQRRFIKETTKVLNGLHATGRASGFGHDVAMIVHALVGVANRGAPAPAIAEILLDFLVVISHVHHDLGDAVAHQVLDQVLHDRFPQDGNHRLGPILGQRTNASSLAGGQNHAFCHAEFLVAGVFRQC